MSMLEPFTAFKTFVMDKIIKIGNHSIKLMEFEVEASERPMYGPSVYLSFDVSCDLWESLMPLGTLREKAYRDVNNVWIDFIRGDKNILINQFLSIMSRETGLNFHLANERTLPVSLCKRLQYAGKNLSRMDYLELVVYSNNK